MGWLWVGATPFYLEVVMMVTKKVSLAVAAIRLLNVQTPKRSIDLAKELDTSENFLQQVMRLLKNADLIKTQKGPNGGYIAIKNEITFYEICKALKYTHKQMCVGQDDTLASMFKAWVINKQEVV